MRQKPGSSLPSLITSSFPCTQPIKLLCKSAAICSPCSVVVVCAKRMVTISMLQARRWIPTRNGASFDQPLRRCSCEGYYWCKRVLCFVGQEGFAAVSHKMDSRLPHQPIFSISKGIYVRRKSSLLPLASPLPLTKRRGPQTKRQPYTCRSKLPVWDLFTGKSFIFH